MSNELAIPEAEAKALAKAAAEERNGGIVGKLLKFAKGEFYVGDDEIPQGRQFVAHTNDWVRGWVKFADNQPVDRRIGKASQDFEVVERQDLPDLDESKWEKGLDGKPKDPWSRQSYLPLSDAETDEVVTFVSGSHGGRGAIADLCAIAAQNHRRGLPTVALDVRSYRHKVFGRIENPAFRITGWTGGKEMTPQELAAELDDSVPY
jgi:hypothetical protein